MNNLLKIKNIFLIFFIVFLFTINVISCQVKISIPNSQNKNFFIFAVSETQIYVSDFDFNVIYDSNTKRVVGVFLPGIKLNFIIQTPLFFNINGKYIHIMYHYYPDLFILNLKENKKKHVDLGPSSLTAYKSLRQWNDNSVLLAFCDRINYRINLFLVSLNGTINYQISPEISGCSWSIGIVPINYTMVMTFSYLYNEKYSKFFFWEVNESNITLLFSSNSN